MRDYLKEFDDFVEDGEKEMRDITFDSYEAKRDFLNSRSIARHNKYKSLMSEKLIEKDIPECVIDKWECFSELGQRTIAGESPDIGRNFDEQVEDMGYLRWQQPDMFKFVELFCRLYEDDVDVMGGIVEVPRWVDVNNPIYAEGYLAYKGRVLAHIKEKYPAEVLIDETW